MTPLFLALFLIVIGIVTLITGLVWISIPFFILAVLAFLWALVAIARGDGGTAVMHRTRKAELLGPGGPDDPDA
jgi:hypothetical protein